MTHSNPNENAHYQPSSNADKTKLTIWVDADACPAAVKDIIFRTSERLKLETILVANSAMRIPDSKWIKLHTVPHGANVADNYIVNHLRPNDVAITADVPLAARVVKKGGLAIGPRGKLYNDDTIHELLATRDLMEQIRASGLETRGPKPMDKKDVQAFANQLDRLLTKAIKKRKPKQ